MLELRHLSRCWPGFAVRDVSLRVEHGQYFVLLGPSGAGKTLLLELVAGFHRPDAGSVHLDGQDVTSLPPEKRRMGFVYQDAMLFPHRSVAQNIAYGLRTRRRPAAEIRGTVRRLAEMLRIGALLHRRPDTLSGGERQRASMARALAVQPEVLLMDEPLGALDPLTQQALRAELRRVHSLTGVTVVHVTHDQDEARELGQRVGILRNGSLLQVGRPETVFERPGNHFVARFTGSRNIYGGRARREGGVTLIRCGEAELVSSADLTGPVRAVIRPENILISRRPVRTSARNQLAGRVTRVDREGNVYAVTADCEGLEMTSVVTGQALQELEIEPGARVHFSFKASSLHLMPTEESDHD